MTDEEVRAMGLERDAEGYWRRPSVTGSATVQPSVQNVDTALDDAALLIRRFVTAHKHVSNVCATWVVHAYAIRDFWTTPRLIIESPEPECGKSMLLDVIGFELEEPMQDVSISAAALVRTLENRTPAFLLDECDKHIGRDDAAQNEGLSVLLSVANVGYRRGKTVTRCVGNSHQPKSFPTFAPMAFAGLNSKLDKAFRTRGISLWLDRARPRREFEWDENLSAEFASLRTRLRAWADMHADEIKAARPERPAWMTGRFAELWLPLFKIAYVRGGPWPRRIREAAEALSVTRGSEHDSWSVALLRTTRDVFGEQERIHSADLIAGLNAVEDAPWAAWNNGEGLRPIDFTRRVIDHFKIHHAKSMRIGEENRKGYERQWFEAAWARYVTDRSPLREGPQPVTVVTSLCGEGNSAHRDPSQPEDGQTPRPLQHKECDGVTGSEPKNGASSETRSTDLGRSLALDPDAWETDRIAALDPAGEDHGVEVAQIRRQAVLRKRARHDPPSGTAHAHSPPRESEPTSTSEERVPK